MAAEGVRVTFGLHGDSLAFVAKATLEAELSVADADLQGSERVEMKCGGFDSGREHRLVFPEGGWNEGQRFVHGYGDWLVGGWVQEGGRFGCRDARHQEAGNGGSDGLTGRVLVEREGG